MTAHVIGAGLAGCEAAWQLSRRGVPVTLYEMKPRGFSEAHQNPDFAELVCSNSLKAMRLASASGLLKEEMRRLGSLTLLAAAETAVPAGGALAVDRDRFSRFVTEKIRAERLVTVVEGEVTSLPHTNPGEPVIVAAGPLCSGRLSSHLQAVLGVSSLSFFDAAAPVVSADSIEMDKVFFSARYGRGTPDYLNCPMDKAEYEAFYEALVSAETAQLHEFEKEFFRVYEGCMPIEVMAKRGADTIRFGPLRPVGLTDPKTGHRPWAVVQLRREDKDGTRYNLVGFQTNLTFSAQRRVFSLIPGLRDAAFVRYGVMHRNTFLDAPRLLDEWGRFRENPALRFAGQITGVEGYMESAASGILSGLVTAREIAGKSTALLPEDTMLGALQRHLTNGTGDYQPMGSNMGLLPPLEGLRPKKQERYEQLARRAIASLDIWIRQEEIQCES